MNRTDMFSYSIPMEAVTLEKIFWVRHGILPFMISYSSIEIKRIKVDLDAFTQIAQDLRIDRPTSRQTKTTLYESGNCLLSIYDPNDGPGRLQICAPTNEQAAAMAQELDLENRAWKSDEKISFGLVIQMKGGMWDIQFMELDKVAIDISSNYPPEFAGFSASMESKLKSGDGLYLLGGPPGTGKTYYIRHLAQTLKRRFLIVPAGLVQSLDSPMVLPILAQHSNSVLVLEDAEQCLFSRDKAGGNPSLVSTILNMSEGILSNLLNIALILTYNTNTRDIDPAALRKGRLRGEWQFGPLPMERAQALILKLGKAGEAKGPMTLAEIYNLEDENFHKPPATPVMGFAKA